MGIQKTSAVALGLAAVACYPTGFDTASETDAIITIRDQERDYSTNRTYVMTSTVYDLGSIVDLDCAVEVEDDLDDVVLDTIRANLDDFGYVEEPDPSANPPDVGIFVGVVVCEGWVAYYYPGWPGWWGPYPPIYYPPPIVGSYEIGTLIFPMVELGDRDPDDPVEVVWFAAVDGLLSSSASTNAARVRRGIDQAFDQSPYLRVGDEVR